MQYHPLRYEAWVRLIGVPLHMWNTEGINRLAVKLGTIQGIQPYGPCARQTEYITIYIVTKHPRHIPKFLKAKEGEDRKSVV